MSEYEYNHINDVIEDLYEKGNLAEDDYDFLCAIVDRVDIYDKHKWHDLRKNPDDLPSDNDCDYTWYECVHENYEEELRRPYYQFDNGEFGYWRDKYHPVSLGFLDSEFETIDDMNLEKVIAWRYIEPFEEGDTDDSK